jgi:hypothetical protein
MPKRGIVANRTILKSGAAGYLLSTMNGSRRGAYSPPLHFVSQGEADQ